MEKTIELRADCGNNAISAMTDVRTANPAREINEAIAVHVFDRCALGSRGEHWRGVIYTARDSASATSH
jgi:hypothetical protein